MAEGEDPLLKNTKQMIRSVVISVKEGVPAWQFNNDYMDFTGETVPFRKLGYSSLDSFIKSIRDVISVRVIQGEEIYFAVADQTTQHLQNLIQKQKTNHKKNVKKRPPTRYPKMHSQVSKTPPSSWGGGHYNKPRSYSRPFPNQTKSFGHQRPHLGDTPTRARSPILPTPFNSENMSPLTVTVRARTVDGEKERVIQKRGGGNGGRQMAQRALQDLMGQRNADRKAGIRYEMPPRFRKNKTNGADAANVPPSARPVAEKDKVANPEWEGSLPSDLKDWTARTLEDCVGGMWASRLVFLYGEEYREPAPDYLIEVVQSWTDIARVELNVVANRYVIYPVKKQETAEAPEEPVTREETPPPERVRKPWQDVIVPVAILFENGEEAKVYASTSTDPGDFYLQRADSCTDEITDMLFDAEEELALPTIDNLKPGVFCAALYSLDSSWYRARVLYHKSNTEVAVIFIDYGNVETVTLDNIRCLTEEIAEIPAQAVNCTMFGIKPLDSDSSQPGQRKGWSEKAKKAFHDMMNGQELDMSTKAVRGGVCVVELWPKDGEISLNEKLYVSKLVDTYLLDNLDPSDLELPQEGYLEVVVAFVDLKHCWLRIIGKEYSEKLEAFEDQLAMLYESARPAARMPAKLQKGSICVAHCDLLYHRIKIREVKNSQADCFFLDHGYTEWLPLDQLALLDVKVNMSLPYQAMRCVLVGLEVYMSNPITITELVERSKNKICVAEVIGRDPLKVMLYDTHGTDDINVNEEIAKKLVNEGHVIDMTLFSPMSDNPSESSRTSASPPPVPVAAATATPQRTSATEPDPTVVEQLQSGTQALTLKDIPTVNKVSVIDNASNASVTVNPSDRTEKSAAAAAGGSEVTVAPPSTVLDSSASVSAGQVSPVPANPYGDSLCVAYNTWPLPGYVPLPDVDVFFAVYVQSVVDPSNFVIVPHNVLGSLEDLMVKMNARFTQVEEGESSEVQTPTKVPSPQANHLYMAVYNGRFYRAIYLATTDKMHHVLLPDYSFHVLISAEEMFFLPKAFWSTPFAAFRASLFGIRPVGGKGEKFWSESVKYKFTEHSLDKTLMAIIKGTETGGNRVVGAGNNDNSDGALQPSKKLLLHLVDTTDPEIDVVISDLLLTTCSTVTTEA